MFEDVLPERAQALLDKITPIVHQEGFYLAGGSGLALQIGHRISEDIDFFKEFSFNTDLLFSLLKQATASSTRILEEKDTLWTLLDGVRCCFFMYGVQLLFAPVLIKGLKVADWRDILAEKFKTVSQRGSKKDFFDIFAAIRIKKLEIGEAVAICKKRFGSADLNFYHVLRSLTYFEDAEGEPDPLLTRGATFSWPEIKAFFLDHIKEFEKHFIE
ncbi:MAG: nucleotidyl transferase AbiEii/AbiGii toxin family protein [Thermodesulfobacteriota bacterium]